MISLFINKQKVLRLQNASFEFLHLKMREIYNQYPFQKQLILEDIMNRTDQHMYGFGCIFIDIADFFSNSKSIHILAELVNQAIIQESPWDPDTFERLTNFHQSLIDYAKQLEQEGK